MEYHEYFELVWIYFPYAFYAFVFLTFFPKSLRKIKRFADADYAANRLKYHRCYGPDLCCHTLIDNERGDDHDREMPNKKPRKVTRSYLRKQQSQQRSNSIDDAVAPPPSISIKRQVQASAIQTQTNVNQIAKMFESGGTGSMAHHRKINRVLPEIRTTMYRSTDADSSDATTTTGQPDEHSNFKTNAKFAHYFHENIENTMNLLNQQRTSATTSTTATSSTAMATTQMDDATLTSAVLQRRTRAIPNTLNYIAGTSATPSTASPAASSPSHSSPASSGNSPVQPSSPILRTHATPFSLKTSVDDIFAAIARSAEKTEEQFMYSGSGSGSGCGSKALLSPVTSIDDILSQRRLSRPLSAYSISDLLMNEDMISANKTEDKVDTLRGDDSGKDIRDITDVSDIIEDIRDGDDMCDIKELKDDLKELSDDLKDVDDIEEISSDIKDISGIKDINDIEDINDIIDMIDINDLADINDLDDLERELDRIVGDIDDEHEHDDVFKENDDSQFIESLLLSATDKD